MSEPVRTVKIGTDVPGEVADELQRIARDTDRSVAAVIRVALRRFIEAEEKAA
jgi:predicted transcriptional regulator